MKFRHIQKIALLILLAVMVERYAHKATDGFTVTNIASPPYTKSEPLPPPLVVKEILDQEFSYLNCGAQSYVFASQDGKYVLKFFKFQHMRVPPWLSKLPLKKKKKKEAIYQQAMQSAKIAYSELKEETGLIYAHTAPSSFFNQTVTIKDKLGIKHYVALSSHEFILQKRATLVYTQIDNWMANGELELAKKGVKDLISLTTKRCLIGIFDKDPDFCTNFGFIGTTPVEIDIGRFSYDEREKEPIVYSDEVYRITRNFKEWLETKHPQLAGEIQ